MQRHALKLLVVGFDGAGKYVTTLPHYSSLMSEAVGCGPLKVFCGHKKELVKTSPNWPSFYTGLPPWVHNIPVFNRMKKGEKMITMASCKFPCSWDILAHGGHRVAVLWMPMTYPVWPIPNGAMISGFPRPELSVAKFMQDGDIATPGIKDTASHDPWQLDVEDRLNPEVVFEHEIVPKIQTATDVARSHDTEAMFMCFTWTDRMMHKPMSRKVTLPEIAGLYLLVDRALQMLDERFDAETLVILSDHGKTMTCDHHDDPGIYLVKSRTWTPEYDMTDMRIDNLFWACLASCGATSYYEWNTDKPQAPAESHATITRQLKSLGYC